jgi:hypothetical protein
LYNRPNWPQYQGLGYLGTESHPTNNNNNNNNNNNKYSNPFSFAYTIYFTVKCASPTPSPQVGGPPLSSVPWLRMCVKYYCKITCHHLNAWLRCYQRLRNSQGLSSVHLLAHERKSDNVLTQASSRIETSVHGLTFPNSFNLLLHCEY